LAAPGEPFALRGCLLTPDRRVDDGWLVIAGGSIVEVRDTAPDGVRTVETSGVVLPGLIDLHGDPGYNVFAAWEPPRQYANRYQWRRSGEYRAVVRDPYGRFTGPVAGEPGLLRELTPVSMSSPSTCWKTRYSSRSDMVAIMPNRWRPSINAGQQRAPRSGTRQVAPGPAASATGGIYVVEVTAAEGPTPEVDEVLGDLCGDPCADDREFRPFCAEGVRIELRPAPLPGFAGTDAERVRSAVAAAWFERERRRLGSPLVPGTAADSEHAALHAPEWAAGTARPDRDAGVPIGLLMSTGSAWVLDVWTARRDRVELPARRWWTERLGQRPEPVFRAQLLQFQAQLAGRPPAPSLTAAGFVELPPAGYLPVEPGVAVDQQIAALFGETVELRYCAAPPDRIGLALEQARHRERIPLTAPKRPARRPRVDVLVPDWTLGTAVPASTVDFAAATVQTTGASQATARECLGLARVERDVTGRFIMAFAGVGDHNDNPRALWMDVRITPNLAAIRVGDRCEIDVRVAATPPLDGDVVEAFSGAKLRMDLEGTFSCRAAGTEDSTTTLDGDFSGRFVRRYLKSVQDDRPVVTAMRVVVTREDDTVLITTKIRDDLFAEVDATRHGTGGFAVTRVKAQHGDVGVEAELRRDPSAALPGSVSRTAMDQALSIFAATELPVLAIDLLLAGAANAESGDSYSTEHDWVFFSRRDDVQCGPDRGTAPDVLLDLYTLVHPAPEELRHEIENNPLINLLERELRPEYVAQLEWTGDTVTLRPWSRAAARAWRTGAGRGFVPGAAVVWFGRWRLPTEFAIPPILAEMGGRAGADITALVGYPSLPRTATSAGVLLVIVAPSATWDE
jgi:hypothetical protein